MLKQQVLEKPQDCGHAQQMLAQLSGQRHQVITAVALADTEQVMSRVVVTDVTFREFTSVEIDRCITGGESMDKAGGCSIQGKNGAFVWSIRDSYHSVVGLPLAETWEMLSEFNAQI